MKKFLSQNRTALHKKKRRWKPKGRQVDSKSVEELLKIIGNKKILRHELIEYIHIIQEKYGIIYKRHLAALAEIMKIPFSEVFEVTTFYAHFNIADDEKVLPPEVVVRVCENLTCAIYGSEEIFNKLLSYKKKNIKFLKGPCMGRCDYAPTVCVGKNYVDNANFTKVVKTIEERKYEIVINKYTNLVKYISSGGYKLLKDFENKKIPFDQIKNIVEKSNLKGKGGAGFPTFKKWEFVLANPEPRYLVINADEGEVGTFKDRYYLETDPHRFLEGVLLSAKIIKAEKVYIYLRDEYPVALQILKNEIQELISKNIVNKDYLIIRRGAGAYICGEESAMIESIEGKRGLPRHRPPFVASVGLFGKPTLVNNVETVYWLRDIIQKGFLWYSNQGINGRKGFHSFSVSGRVKKPGVKIAPAGITIKELIDNYCGGMSSGHKFKAYLPGGASGGILPATLDSIPLDYGVKELDDQGCFLGSAAIVVLSDKDNIKKVGLNLLSFFADESCGQCTPCRVGTEKTVIEMKKDKWDKNVLEDLSKVMAEASICGLGQAATNPLKSIIKHFQEDL